MTLKPLTIVTTWNRLELTRAMLTSLEVSLPYLQTIIVDNGSTDGTQAWLAEWVTGREAELIALPDNIGCPRALNVALEHRQNGQAVIKLDNDVLLPDDPAWVAEVVDLDACYPQPVGMIAAYFEPWNSTRVRKTETWEGLPLHHVFPVIGHAVYHSGNLMDTAHYFDVLSPEHLYGFEDNLISVKAALCGMVTVAWAGWKVRDIQRHSALGNREAVGAHVAAMRPLYERRMKTIAEGGPLRNGPDGMPINGRRKVLQ